MNIGAIIARQAYRWTDRPQLLMRSEHNLWLFSVYLVVVGMVGWWYRLMIGMVCWLVGWPDGWRPGCTTA